MNKRDRLILSARKNFTWTKKQIADWFKISLNAVNKILKKYE